MVISAQPSSPVRSLRPLRLLQGELNQKPTSPHSKKSKSVGSAEKGAAGSAASNGLLTAKHAITTQPDNNSGLDASGDDTHSRKGSLAGKILARDF